MPRFGPFQKSFICSGLDVARALDEFRNWLIRGQVATVSRGNSRRATQPLAGSSHLRPLAPTLSPRAHDS